MQHASVGLVNYDVEVDKEKDVLLENFARFGVEVCKIFERLGIFADYFDPCSGLPAIHKDCNQVFSEVQAAQALHHYQIMNAGCCKILLHPVWGSAVYPASIVIHSTASEVLAALENRLIVEESHL